MGRGPLKKPLPEIDETRAAGKDAAFEAIIERITSSGGNKVMDETTPMYTDVGMEEFEMGSQRIIEFAINSNEFQLIRKTETHILQGGGHQKHLEELDVPRSRMILKKKDDATGTWQVMDIDEIF